MTYRVRFVNEKNRPLPTHPAANCDPESHSWTGCEEHFVLSPDGERVRVRGCHSEQHEQRVKGVAVPVYCECGCFRVA